MRRFLRVVLLALIAVMMINLVLIGVLSEDTGPLEKGALGLIGLALLYAAYLVQTRPRRTSSS